MVVLIGCLIPGVAICINFLNSFVIDDIIVHRVTGRFVIFLIIFLIEVTVVFIVPNNYIIIKVCLV